MNVEKPDCAAVLAQENIRLVIGQNLPACEN